jgi:hypothetical protein
VAFTLTQTDTQTDRHVYRNRQKQTDIDIETDTYIIREGIGVNSDFPLEFFQIDIRGQLHGFQHLP